MSEEASTPPLHRVTRTAQQLWKGAPQRILPLLTPLGEKAWALGWEPDLRWQPPKGRQGTVFVTHNHGPREALWLLETFDAARLYVGYLYVCPGFLLVELSVGLTPLGKDRTAASVRYTYTALSAAGSAHVDAMTEGHYAAFMREWEQQLNHFLETGRKLGENS
jgi:hypothetical protein